MGEDGATNLRETPSILNRSTTNLAEDTEALKHEFFFRSFSQKRSFYDLDWVTPVEYRAACVRQKKVGTREWLQAVNLVEWGADGREQLSGVGRQQIDDALAPLVETLPGELIMVEGYSSIGSVDQEYTLSRRRADLVRSYLETYYDLRHEDIGIVTLGDKPPNTVGKETWDGAAIIMLKASAGE